MVQKGLSSFYLIFSLVSLVLIIGGFYFLNFQKSKQAPSLTSSLVNFSKEASPSLKTFLNKDLGFSFIYPGNQQLEEDKESLSIKDKNYSTDVITLGQLSNTNHIGETVDSYMIPALELFIIKDSSLSINDLVETFPQDNLETEEIIIDNLALTKVSHLGCLSGDCINFLFKKGDLVFNLSKEATSLEDFDFLSSQILSSLKFTP